jgi:hypothetical protein
LFGLFLRVKSPKPARPLRRGLDTERESEPQTYFAPSRLPYSVQRTSYFVLSRLRRTCRRAGPLPRRLDRMSTSIQGAQRSVAFLTRGREEAGPAIRRFYTYMYTYSCCRYFSVGFEWFFEFRRRICQDSSWLCSLCRRICRIQSVIRSLTSLLKAQRLPGVGLAWRPQRALQYRAW